MKTNEQLILINQINDTQFLKNYKNDHIITFDFDSHKKLVNNDIKHEISENFINSNELKTIEQNLEKLSFWFNEYKNNLFEINDIHNIGELYTFEFRNVLGNFLKIYFELVNIISRYNDTKIFATKQIYKILFNMKIDSTLIKTNQSNSNSLNYIEFPIKLGPTKINLKFSQKNFNNIKKFTESIFPLIIKNQKINPNWKNILLVNFSTLRCKSFLSQLNNFDKNFIKYDSLIPAVFNNESYQIINNSHCIFETKNSLLRKKIGDSQKINKIKKLLESIDLESHFRINEHIFWKNFKPIFTEFFSSKLQLIFDEINTCEQLLQKYDFSKILVFNETGLSEQIIINIAKKKHIPVYLLQHGLHYDTDEMYQENKFQRIIPKKSDFLICWDKLYENNLIKKHVDKNKLYSCPPIFFENLEKKIIHQKNSYNKILLASDPLAFYNLLSNTVDEKEKYDELIKTVSIICNSKKLLLDIKTHPQKYQNEEQIVKQINQNFHVYHSGEIHSLISNSDLVIVTDYSTVLLESLILRKPVVSIRLREHYGRPSIFEFIPQIRLSELESFIEKYYNDNDFRVNLLNKGNEFLNNYYLNLNNASEILNKILSNSI